MTYLERLHPWCIIRPFPDMRTLIVGRFRRRVDAEGHLRVLKQLMPTVPYAIVFDMPPEHTDSEDIEESLQH
jgi:hypothetical protein